MLKISECRKFKKKCLECGKVKIIKRFSKEKNGKDGRRKICNKCQYARNKNRYTLICVQCGKEFKSQIKTGKFCSIQCHAEWRKTNYTGESNPLYKRIRCDLRGENSPHYNKESHIFYKCEYCGKESHDIISSYSRKKHHFCSNECKGKWQIEYFKGSNNPNWNHNKTKEERENSKRRNLNEGYNSFVKEVLKRDNYTCQLTGQYGGKLEVHHLNNYLEYKEERTDINNGITLSKEIHRLYHKIYGNRHNTKEQFEEFKQKYINKEF